MLVLKTFRYTLHFGIFSALSFIRLLKVALAAGFYKAQSFPLYLVFLEVLSPYAGLVALGGRGMETIRLCTVLVGTLVPFCVFCFLKKSCSGVNSACRKVKYSRNWTSLCPEVCWVRGTLGLRESLRRCWWTG